MGNISSKVNCGDIHLYRKYIKSNRRPALKIDKSKIGIPTDFRHTYHVGNNSPVTIDLLDTIEPTTPKSTTVTDTEFLATIAQITEALKMYPIQSPDPIEKPSCDDDLQSGYFDFRSGLQSQIDAQIVELARARSKQKRPSIMI